MLVIDCASFQKRLDLEPILGLARSEGTPFAPFAVYACLSRALLGRNTVGSRESRDRKADSELPSADFVQGFCASQIRDNLEAAWLQKCRKSPVLCWRNGVASSAGSGSHRSPLPTGVT